HLPLHLLSSFDTAARPPSPTLFPSTTLFRSREAPGFPTGHPGRARDDARSRSIRLNRLRAVGAVTAHELAAGDHQDRPQAVQPEDRKSTRLNSSHDQISYAVFCLKKKKIQQR